MDFSTLRKNVNNRKYGSSGQFLNDVRLIYQNCVTYNGADHPFSMIALNVVKVVEESLEEVGWTICFFSFLEFNSHSDDRREILPARERIMKTEFVSMIIEWYIIPLQFSVQPWHFFNVVIIWK